MRGGRREVCNNSIGGVKAIYLMDFKKYPKHLIELNKDKTQLLSFPVTIIYQVQLRAATSYDQEINEDRSISQSIEVALKKDSVQTMQEVRILIKKELRVIVEDRLGRFWLMGLHNGVTIDSYSRTSGGAKGDFNGYNLTFSAQEEFLSPYIDSLDNSGFIEVPEGETLWRASDTTIYGSNNTKLISELYL